MIGRRLTDFTTGALAATRTEHRLRYIDLALVLTAVLLFAGDATVLSFHIMFVLLTLSAFFWELRAFVWRAAFWVPITTAAVFLDVLVGRIPAEELIEIPLLSAILVGVFLIARRRAEIQEQLLEQDQAFLEAVLENMEEAVVACDSDGKLAFSNSAARLFHGLPAEDLPLERWADHYQLNVAEGEAPIDKDGIPIFRALRGEQIKDEEICIVPEEGSSRFVLVSGNRMTSASGTPTGAVVVMRDITERKRVERELQARALQGEIVASLGQRALASYDPHGLMDETVSLITRTLGVECCIILELPPEGDLLLPISAYGWAEGSVGEESVGREPGSLAAYTLASSEPVVIEDLGTEARFEIPPLVEGRGVVSGVSLAIHGQERPFGILCAFTAERRIFARDDLHFLQAVANVLTSAYDRKLTERRLHETQENERERIARELHDTVLQDISQAISVIETTRSESGALRVDPGQVAGMLRRAVRALRYSIYDLSHREEREQPLLALLENLVQHSREISPQLEVDLHVEDGFPKKLAQPAKTALLRLTQEALVNVRRHAGASRVRINLRAIGDQAEVEVADDGKGFEPETVLGGFGLKGMRGRALELGGELEVLSEPGSGTMVRFMTTCSRLRGEGLRHNPPGEGRRLTKPPGADESSSEGSRGRER